MRIYLRRTYLFNIFILGIIFSVIPLTVFAQLTQPSSNSSFPAPILGQPTIERNIITPSPDALIFDGAIDPKEYHLGPGDILQYRSFYNNDSYNIMVSADQMVVVPRIGEFSVKNKSFADVKEEIRSYSAKQFKKAHIGDSIRGDFSLTLAQPRRIVVSVLGEVETPGVYTLTGGTRADIAVKIADKPVQRQAIIADEARQKELDKRKREADRVKPYLGDETQNTRSLRYIVIRHSDGSSDRLDMARFNATRDPRFCPLLREGDVVYVPFRKTTAGGIGVYGAVNSPQDFEYVENDSLWGMILAAFGPTPGANLTAVEITRMSTDGANYETRTIDALAIKEHRATDIKLESGDRIFVRDNPDFREISRVIVKGEVMRPGVYPIHRVDTKLSDVIKQAGGFTSYAFLSGGTVTRKKLDIDNKDITHEEEAKLVGRVSNLEVYDTADFRFQTELREGYVAVDMLRLFEKGDATQDITLRDGDVVSIPATPTTVYVWGYVGSVGYIPYKYGADENYYINAAGGYAEGSEKSRTRVIKARTRKWEEAGKTQIEAGDEIYVPKEGTYPENYSLQKTQIIVSIISSIAVVVSIVVALSK